ncbi:flagellar hook-associated protein FlgK [Desulfofustis limnaeus]|uniref:Flagellar hook-associated protein 1 n=1 Tax=Desulfofustis limnaeus TaxID=2740163 RepID=A0ABN6M7F0_9BACT|nr:flagellar hook-associated protein FlgK [Desulfofustis limnaeus]BDD87362.1 flagellar hook-associated protein 1 [Desulfofustis limnaeus]
MAGLFNALNAARTSLEVNQKSIEIVGNNISNVNTEGYSRQVAQLSPYPATNFGDFFIGHGVKIDNVRRDHDVFLQAQLQDKYIDFGYANGKTRTLNELERAFNITEENIATNIDRYFDAWQELSAYPSDLVLRDTVIQRGELLAVDFNNTANELNTITENINDTIIAKIEDINDKLNAIADLNERIFNIEVRGQMANSARDQRDVLVKDLAEQLGALTYEDRNGMLNLQLPGGLPLVQGNSAMELEANTTGADVTLRLHAAGVTRDLSTNTLGGEMLGLFTMRDQFIPELQENLDYLAWNLAEQVNARHRLGAGLDSVDDRSFFNDLTLTVPPADYPHQNAARNIAVVLTDAVQVAAALPPGALGTVAPGDNRNALLMSNIGEQYLIDGIDNFNAYYGKMTSRIGIEANQNDLALSGAQDAVDQLENLRDGFVGVSLEEEMISLIQYQRGFQSSAKFLTTVDELMESLLTIKR